MKIDTILVPTDFSDDANKAISTAMELAPLFGARIVVLHAYHLEIPMATPMGDGAYTLPSGFFEELEAQATAQVEKIAKELSEVGTEVTGIAVQQSASVAIVAQAESLPADIIIMGTRGNTGLKHVVLGSVAERVVRMAPCPVLTVKAKG